MGDQLQNAPILVFLGPTLRLAEAQACLDAIYLPPAAQGDIVLAAHAFRPRAMVLIDGQFEDRPAVRHKEILWAMAQGIGMIGAASMGALRAAELHELGMVGTGLIYRWYRRWPLTPDDAVAVQFGPVELGFPAVTDALIDLQRTFASLMRRRIITVAERRVLGDIAGQMNFRDRTLEAVCGAAGWTQARSGALRKEIVRQKRLDALQALRLAPEFAIKSGGNKPRETWVATNTFLRDLEASNIDTTLINTY